jgi:hypothetical protein
VKEGSGKIHTEGTLPATRFDLGPLDEGSHSGVCSRITGKPEVIRARCPLGGSDASSKVVGVFISSNPVSGYLPVCRPSAQNARQTSPSRDIFPSNSGGAAEASAVREPILLSLIVGYSMRRRFLLAMLVVPLTVAVVLTLVTELDSPRSGFIQIEQQSMERLQLDLRMQLAPAR